MSHFWQGKRVAVAGGAGFIGSHLIELLLDAGARATISLRGACPPGFYDAVGQDIAIVECDLRDMNACRSFVKDQEIVLYLAASVGGIQFNMKHPASIFQDNLRPFLNTIEAARDAEIERFLVTSSACVYPRFCTIPTPEEEGFEGMPEPTNLGYGMAKRAEEFVGQQYAAEFGMKVAIARPFNAYGPRDNFDPERSHVIPGLIQRIFEEEENPLQVWGSGNQTRSFLYVTDCARGLMEVTEKYAEADPVNLGSEEEVTIRGLVERLVHLQGQNTEIVFDTARPEGYPRRACDTEKARDKVGFQTQVRLDEGLRRTVDWFLAQGMVRKSP